ncbi:MAG TPA: amidohydrolase family protein, partial [Gemmataceae bacterium]|nr:amidohydrolase family protein [Gemmataceae bacterium]
MSELVITARWLFPIAQPPLENGLLVIDGERIAAILPPGSRKADLDLGNCAILPGLVNAHTHLDLSGMRGVAPPSADFIDWLKQVIAFRKERSPAQVTGDIRAGLAESLRSGTTLLGDISANGQSWRDLAEAPLRSVVFQEMIGLTKRRAAEAVLEFRAWREAFPQRPNCRPGLSPHAPYSVRFSLFLYAATSSVPVSVHLAESKAEMDLLFARQGPFVEFLQELGAWDAEGLSDGPDHVLQTMTGVDPVLFIHCNYLWPNIPFPPNGSIVYCPRTHAAFGHPLHPFRDFLARGIRVALGTDSLASNPDLSILNEMRFLHQQHPDLSGEVILRMATLSGAEALGWANECGSLESGKSADFVVLPLEDREAEDAHELWLESDQSVEQVWYRG